MGVLHGVRHYEYIQLISIGCFSWCRPDTECRIYSGDATEELKLFSSTALWLPQIRISPALTFSRNKSINDYTFSNWSHR